MASFVTVNIAAHFIFNWKIEKSKYFATIIGSSAYENSRLSLLSSIKSRIHLPRYSSNSSISPDYSSKAILEPVTGRKNSVNSIDGSRGKGSRYHLSKQRSSLKGLNHRLGEDSPNENPPTINQNILKKSSSEKNMVMAPRSTSFTIHMDHYFSIKPSRSGSYEEKQDDIIGDGIIASTYDNKRPSHKAGGNGSMLVPLQEETSIVVCESEKL